MAEVLDVEETKAYHACSERKQCRRLTIDSLSTRTGTGVTGARVYGSQHARLSAWPRSPSQPQGRSTQAQAGLQRSCPLRPPP